MKGYLYLRGAYGVTVGRAMYFKGDGEDREQVSTISEDMMRQIMALARESERRGKSILGKAQPVPRAPTRDEGRE